MRKERKREQEGDERPIEGSERTRTRGRIRKRTREQERKTKIIEKEKNNQKKERRRKCLSRSRFRKVRGDCRLQKGEKGPLVQKRIPF